MPQLGGWVEHADGAEKVVVRGPRFVGVASKNFVVLDMMMGLLLLYLDG